MMRYSTLALSLFLSGCSMNNAVSTRPEPVVEQVQSAELKRVSIWVSDLDRAIEFYEYVLGFRLAGVGDLDVPDDSVLYNVFNNQPGTEIRRAYFSSDTEERVLFVMASKDAPSYTAEHVRHNAMVIRSQDLEGVLARAVEKGFKIGASQTSLIPGTDTEFKEVVISGPNGHGVLIYQVLPAVNP